MRLCLSILIILLVGRATFCLATELTPDAEGNLALVGGSTQLNTVLKVRNLQIGPQADEGNPQEKRTPTELVLGKGAAIHTDELALESLKIYPGSSLVLQGGSLPQIGRIGLLGSILGEGYFGLQQVEMFSGSRIQLNSGTFYWGGMPFSKGLNPTLRIGGEFVIAPKVKVLFDGNMNARINVEPSGSIRGAFTWLFPTQFVMSGTVVADGFGEQQDLDFRKLVLTKKADAANAETKPSGGWKAINRGRLLLPTTLPTADGSAQPGQPSDKRPTLPGVVRVANANEPVEAAILATDRDELKDSPVRVVGAWQIIGAVGSTLELCYDDEQRKLLGGEASQLQAFSKTLKGWEKITDQSLVPEKTVLTKTLPADGLIVVGFVK